MGARGEVPNGLCIAGLCPVAAGGRNGGKRSVLSLTLLLPRRDRGILCPFIRRRRQNSSGIILRISRRRDIAGGSSAGGLCTDLGARGPLRCIQGLAHHLMAGDCPQPCPGTRRDARRLCRSRIPPRFWGSPMTRTTHWAGGERGQLVAAPQSVPRWPRQRPARGRAARLS